MMKREKMICPNCGAEMNHHANKIDYTSAPEDEEAIDTEFGGVVQEAHTCPECGQTALREAVDERLA
jgi:ribosomal protein S27AE